MLDNRFLSNHTRTTDKKKERGLHNLQLIREQKTGQSFLFYILKDNQYMDLLKGLKGTRYNLGKICYSK